MEANRTGLADRHQRTGRPEGLPVRPATTEFQAYESAGRRLAFPHSDDQAAKPGSVVFTERAESRRGEGRGSRGWRGTLGPHDERHQNCTDIPQGLTALQALINNCYLLLLASINSTSLGGTFIASRERLALYLSTASTSLPPTLSITLSSAAILCSPTYPFDTIFA